MYLSVIIIGSHQDNFPHILPLIYSEKIPATLYPHHPTCPGTEYEKPAELEVAAGTREFGCMIVTPPGVQIQHYSANSHKSDESNSTAQDGFFITMPVQNVGGTSVVFSADQPTPIKHLRFAVDFLFFF